MTMTVFTAVEACWFAKLLFDLFGTAILTLFGSLSLDQATCCLFARYFGFDILENLLQGHVLILSPRRSSWISSLVRTQVIILHRMLSVYSSLPRSCIRACDKELAYVSFTKVSDCFISNWSLVVKRSCTQATMIFSSHTASLLMAFNTSSVNLFAMQAASIMSGIFPPGTAQWFQKWWGYETLSRPY